MIEAGIWVIAMCEVIEIILTLLDYFNGDDDE